jgi:Wax ester synthase-like Acyl-CoA acyltransferase domain
VVAARLRVVPRFRQLLYVPWPGLGRPLWVDAPVFDLADHVRVVPVRAPGDEAALLRAAEQLGGSPGPVPAAVADVAAARAAAWHDGGKADPYAIIVLRSNGPKATAALLFT